MSQREFEKRKRQRERRIATIGSAVIFVGMIALYWVATDLTAWLDPVIFPGWGVILPDTWSASDLLLKGLFTSLRLLLPALALAILSAITLGTLIGMNPLVKLVLMPLFRAFNPIPPTMLIPYAIAVLPTFWLSSAAIIFVGVFWPVLMGTLYGVAMLEPRWLDNARCLGLRGRRLVFKVILPGAMPQIFSGIGSGLIFSFILLTVAEMFGAEAGMGYFVQYYADFAEYGRVIGGMIFLSIVVVILMAIYDLIQRRVLHWTRQR